MVHYNCWWDTANSILPKLPGKERLSQHFSDNALLVSANPENEEEGKWNEAETIESNG